MKYEKKYQTNANVRLVENDIYLFQYPRVMKWIDVQQKIKDEIIASCETNNDDIAELFFSNVEKAIKSNQWNF